MGALSQYRPDTRAPGGGGMNYAGNPVGGGMGAQFNFGGPAQMPQPGVGRFQPRGMVPPAGARPQPGEMTGPYTRQRFPQGDPRRYGNPRQVNPGQPGLQPGPAPMPDPIENMPMPDVIDPGYGQPPMRGKGGGGGKGGYPGPGRPGRPGRLDGPSIGMPVERPSPGVMPDDYSDVYNDGGGAQPGVMPDDYTGDGGGGFGGLNARADGRDPFEFGEDPTPAPVQRNQPMNQYTRTRAPRIR